MMPFRPLTEEERTHYENEIKWLQEEIDTRQHFIDYFKERIKEGQWYSDTKVE